MPVLDISTLPVISQPVASADSLLSYDSKEPIGSRFSQINLTGVSGTYFMGNGAFSPQLSEGAIPIVGFDGVFYSDLLVWAGEGFLGVGTATPTATLDVNGSINIKSGAPIDSAMSGDMLLVCSPIAAGTSAAVLNAAAAGTFTKTLTVSLQDSYRSEEHTSELQSH